MSDLFSEAQAAVDAGNLEHAHVLLAKLLKQDRHNAAAWYLLSTIVPSVEQEAIFLHRVLKLEPTHAAAAVRVAQLESATPAPVISPTLLQEEPAAPQKMTVPVSQDAEDFDAQAKGDTLPPWLAAEEGTVMEPVATSSILESAETATSAMDIPDWLQEMPTPDWEQERQEAIAAARAATVQPAPTPAPAPAPSKPAKSAGSSSTLLIVLVVAAVVVLVILIYMLITLGPTLF